MPEDVVVKVGQVWADNDKRSADRTLKVLAVVDGRALVQEITGRNPGRTTKVSVSRMKPTSTGYKLVEDSSQ